MYNVLKIIQLLAFTMDFILLSLKIHPLHYVNSRQFTWLTHKRQIKSLGLGFERIVD